VLLRLRREDTLRLRSVPLALAVLLERVLHRHLLPAEELAVEVLDRLVGCLKVVEADKPVALGLARGGVARDLASMLNSLRLTFGVSAIAPKRWNVSYSSCSLTPLPRLPMKRLAPTSICFLSYEALLARMGLPNSLIWFMILQA
jgi:hypothetical protein